MSTINDWHYAQIAAICHCGKDGHALNSVNCPVHGGKIRRETEEHYAKLADRKVLVVESFNDAHIRIRAVPPDTVYAMAVSDYMKFDLDEDADAYEAAAREEFEPRPIAMVYDFTTIHHFADQLRFEEDEATAASQEDIDAARERQPYHRASSAGVFDFDAIRYHLNVMHGDDINGTMYSHEKRWAYTEQTGYRTQRTREHDFDIRTRRCTACLWSAQHVLDGMAHSHCEGRPPKGEPCMNCGKPHVVSIQHRGNWMTQCLSCFQGVMTNGPIKDRGAVRFEQRMRERAQRDDGLQAVERFLKYCGKTITPEDKAHVQAFVDSAHMGGGGRIAGPTRADRMQHNAQITGLMAAAKAKSLNPALLVGHPENCVCDVCIPF